MPWRRILKELVKSSSDADDTLAAMVTAKVDTAAILSAALGYPVNVVKEVAEGRGQFTGVWLALEMARQQLELTHTVRAVRKVLQEQISRMEDEGLKEHADNLKVITQRLTVLLYSPCEHDWQSLRIVGMNINGACVCTKCGAIRPEWAEPMVHTP